ncbi:hypothetical protein OS493_039284, partial [Desmophyllum pertusum]
PCHHLKGTAFVTEWFASRMNLDVMPKESEALHKREVQLREREKALRDAEKLSQTTDIIIDKVVTQEVENRCRAVVEEYEHKLVELEETINKKTKELRRMKESFDTIKTANDSLKKQRKNEFLQRNSKPDDKQMEKQRNNKLTSHGKEDVVTKSVSFSQNKVNFAGLFEVLGVLLEWISEAHLQKMPTFQDSPQGRLQEQQLDFPSALVHEKCLKILPGISDILCTLPSFNPRVQQPCLQFTYWSVVFMEQTVQGSQRTALASTLRHIGEELYKPQVTKVSEEGATPKSDKQKVDIYFNSPKHRLDYLAHVFDVLKTDLKDDVALLGSAVDVMLLMSVDSPFTAAFLDSCSNEALVQDGRESAATQGTGS